MHQSIAPSGARYIGRRYNIGRYGNFFTHRYRSDVKIGPMNRADVNHSCVFDVCVRI